MKTDGELLDFVKGHLEEGAPLAPSRLEDIRRAAAACAPAQRRAWHRRLWWRGLSLAASLAVACGVFFACGTLDREPDAEHQVAAALELLNLVDETPGFAAEAATPVEQLSSWQDAPYRVAATSVLATL